jgi:hypothetical protein
VAYRRLLCELLWMRMCRREDVGEATGPRSLPFIIHELDALEDVIRRDANAFLAGSEEVRRGRPLGNLAWKGFGARWVISLGKGLGPVG